MVSANTDLSPQYQSLKPTKWQHESTSDGFDLSKTFDAVDYTLLLQSIINLTLDHSSIRLLTAYHRCTDLIMLCQSVMHCDLRTHKSQTASLYFSTPLCPLTLPTPNLKPDMPRTGTGHISPSIRKLLPQYSRLTLMPWEHGIGNINIRTLLQIPR